MIDSGRLRLGGGGVRAGDGPHVEETAGSPRAWRCWARPRSGPDSVPVRARLRPGQRRQAPSRSAPPDSAPVGAEPRPRQAGPGPIDAGLCPSRWRATSRTAPDPVPNDAEPPPGQARPRPEPRRTPSRTSATPERTTPNPSRTNQAPPQTTPDPLPDKRRTRANDAEPLPDKPNPPRTTPGPLPDPTPRQGPRVGTGLAGRWSAVRSGARARPRRVMPARCAGGGFSHA